MKKILVTGGAGFIGSHLCEKLIGMGNRVICLDNFLTGSKENIRHLFGHSSFELVKQDILMPFTLQVDEIYHLACPASPYHYQKDPVMTSKIAVIGTLNVLEIARKAEAKILLASTSEVYGEPHIHPQSEQYWGNVNPIGIRSCYDEGKRCAETMLFDYYRQHQLPIKLVRIFNTYGPRLALEDGRVISNFIVQALRNESITIHGKGEQTRTFCYIDDLIDGLISMMATGGEITGPLNLGSEREISVFELARIIVHLTGSRSKFLFRELPQDDPSRRCPDISRAKKILGWSPGTNLERGLEQTISYFSDLTGCLSKDR